MGEQHERDRPEREQDIRDPAAEKVSQEDESDDRPEREDIDPDREFEDEPWNS